MNCGQLLRVTYQRINVSGGACRCPSVYLLRQLGACWRMRALEAAQPCRPMSTHAPFRSRRYAVPCPQDAFRRDFTINALFYNISEGGVVEDLTGKGLQVRATCACARHVKAGSARPGDQQTTAPQRRRTSRPC